MTAGVPQLTPAWRRAVSGEISWVEPDGAPQAMSVLPLLDGTAPCAAVPYAQAAAVQGLRAAGAAAFAVTDSRSLPGSHSGPVAFGRIAIRDDTAGDYFAHELLSQELAKYPPTRTLTDSPLLRREHWWWLPRILIRLERVTTQCAVPVRTDPARHALLLRADAAGMRLETVATGTWTAPVVKLSPWGRIACTPRTLTH